MMMAELMALYHWTYQDYISQPTWVIDLLIEKYRIDAKRTEMAMKKMGG